MSSLSPIHFNLLKSTQNQYGKKKYRYQILQNGKLENNKYNQPINFYSIINRTPTIPISPDIFYKINVHVI